VASCAALASLGCTPAVPDGASGELETATALSTGGSATGTGEEEGPADVQVFGDGAEDLEVWYQEWEGTSALMQRVAESYSQVHTDATVALHAIEYSDLYDQLLPAIAGGEEGDIMMMYTNWVVGSDITQVFLDVTDAIGGYGSFVEEFWEAPLTIVDAPAERVFYLPWLAGARGAVITVNRDHLAEDDIEPLDFRSWDEVVDAGKKLTRRTASGAMTRAGYAVNTSHLGLLYNIIWQLGASMYDQTRGTWSWLSDEGIEGVRRLDDLYSADGTSSHDLYPSEFQGASQGLVSMWGEGAWTASVQAETNGISTDNIATPRVADGVTDYLFPDHVAGWGLSRRLADEPARLQLAIDLVREIVGPDAMVEYHADQSSLCASKVVYADPGIGQVRYGPMCRRVATEMWPRARYNGDHVAEMGPASGELDRALRREVTAEEALTRMDEYCQGVEDAYRDQQAT
jgi:ABC-type glycerol-3-phosphate transport system substrate-binding protein